MKRVYLLIGLFISVTVAGYGLAKIIPTDNRPATRVAALAQAPNPLDPGQPLTPSSFSFASPTFTGALSSPRQYPYAGVRLDVPPAGARPAVSATAAYALCKTTAPCLVNSAPTIELALFSDDQYGATASEPVNGSDPAPLQNLPFQNVLTWVITWRQVECEVHGPPGLPPPPPSFATGCDQVDFVDATTGSYLVGISGKSAF